ncbi:MAG: alpha/beta fold hydrolase, partial [Pseudomonadota bacterium]
MLAAWQAQQQAFWTAAAAGAAVETPDGFALPDWQAFEGFWAQLADPAHLCADNAPAQAMARAAGVYRALLAETWGQIADQFRIQCRAMGAGTGQPPDWRAVRDRWFQIAEGAFITLQRSDRFLAAQRDAVRAAIAVHHALPREIRRELGAGRRQAAEMGRTLSDVDLSGIEIAATPKDEIWRDGAHSVARYRPLGGQAPQLGPVLICHGLIGRQTMTDLRPDRSLVRNLLAAGVDVFVADWGNTGAEDRHHGFGHYAFEQMQAMVDAVVAASGAAGVTLLGICMGGTMAAAFAASMPRHLDRLMLAVTPIDCHADVHDADPAHGLLNLWVRSLEPEDLSALVDIDGTLSGLITGLIFNQLNPVRTLQKYAVEMLEIATDRAQITTFLAMEKWLADRPDLPGALAKTWLIDLYHRNDLVEGRFAPTGQPVDLA